VIFAVLVSACSPAPSPMVARAEEGASAVSMDVEAADEDDGEDGELSDLHHAQPLCAD
jgi:hypothetical protein